MQDTVVEKAFCTTREAADMLGVAVSTVQLWVENGLLKAWKTSGGHRRVLRESVEALLHKQPALTPGAQRPAAQRKTGGTRQFRILVVEDDPILLRLYQANMTRWDMQPEVAVHNNAVSALLEMGRRSPDLLITDLNMPGMDGFNMLRVLSQAPTVARTRMVVVTGLSATDVRERGTLPVGIEVLPKPVPFERLLAIANEVQLRNFHPAKGKP